MTPQYKLVGSLGWLGRWIAGLLGGVFFFASAAWGLDFGERKEMNLSAFAYTRATWALSRDNIGFFKGLWQRGNLVQHRNFVTLEWKHKLARQSREFPLTQGIFEWLDLDDLNYYLDARFEYDGVWEWGGNKPTRLRQGGTNHHAKYFGELPPAYPGQFSRQANFEYESSRRRIKEALWQLRLYRSLCEHHKRSALCTYRPAKPVLGRDRWVSAVRPDQPPG